MNLKKIANILVACFISIPAQAAVYDIESPTLGISALITTSDAIDPAVGGYDILGITGTLSGFGNIVGLYPNPSQPFPSNADFGIPDFLVAFDNVLFNGHPYFDAFGMVFQLDGGVLGSLSCVSSASNLCDSVNFGSDPNNYVLFVGNFAVDEVGSITVTAVPEPSTWIMMILGFVCTALLASGRLGGYGALSSSRSLEATDRRRLLKSRFDSR
jgi:hypothetical protein